MSELPESDLAEIVRRRPELWRGLNGAHLFITGGTGFFGRWLVEGILYARDCLGIHLEITLLSRNPQRVLATLPHWRNLRDVHWLEGDVRDFLTPSQRFTHIIHAATDSDPARQNDKTALLDILIGGSNRVFSLAAECGTKRVLYVSSGAVYGRNTYLRPIAEHDRLGPDSMDSNASYAIGKRTAEHMGCIAAAEHRFDFVAARCFAFVGPGMPINGHFAIGNFIRDAIWGDRIVIKGDGTPVRTYLYAADLCFWLYTLLVSAPSGRAFNVGAEQAMNLREVACLVRDSVNPKAEVCITQTPTPDTTPNYYVPNVRRSHEELGLASWTSLETGIRRTVSWLRAHPSSAAGPNNQ